MENVWQLHLKSLEIKSHWYTISYVSAVLRSDDATKRKNEAGVILKGSYALGKRRWYFDLSINKLTDLTRLTECHIDVNDDIKINIEYIKSNNLEFFTGAFATFLTTTANILQVISNHISGMEMYYITC